MKISLKFLLINIFIINNPSVVCRIFRPFCYESVDYFERKSPSLLSIWKISIGICFKHEKLIYDYNKLEMNGNFNLNSKLMEEEKLIYTINCEKIFKNLIIIADNTSTLSSSIIAIDLKENDTKNHNIKLILKETDSKNFLMFYGCDLSRRYYLLIFPQRYTFKLNPILKIVRDNRDRKGYYSTCNCAISSCRYIMVYESNMFHNFNNEDCLDKLKTSTKEKNILSFSATCSIILLFILFIISCLFKLVY